MIKYSIREVYNKVEHQQDADKNIRRLVEALIRKYVLLTRNINGENILCGPRNFHDVEIDGMDIFHRVQEEVSILIFNMAFTYQNYWISTRSHEYLQKSLSLLKSLPSLSKGDNKCTFMERLKVLTDTLATMGGV